MRMRLAGLAAIAVVFFVALAPERFDAQAVPTPEACAAARARAERAGEPGAELDRLVVGIASEDSATVVLAGDMYRAITARVPLGTFPERTQAVSGFMICLRDARIAQLGSAAPIIVTTQVAGTVTGNLAQALVAAWNGATLAAPAEVTAPLNAIAALEAGPADGSRLLLIPIPRSTDPGARQILDAMAPLRRIGMVAGPRTVNPTNSGVALFAPSRTPGERINEFIDQISATVRAASYLAALERAQLPPADRNIGATLAAVLNALNAPAPPPAAPRAAPPPNAGNTTALGNLRPTDVFLEDQGNTFNILVGRTLTEAVANQVRYAGRTMPTAGGPPWQYYSCAQIGRGMRVAWWAVVVGYFDPLRPAGQPNRTDSGYGFACASGTLDQALAAAYDALKGKRNQRLTTYWAYAGVTAELDYARLAREQRLGQPMSAWAVYCNAPSHLDEARASFMPQDPGNGQAFAALLLSHAFRWREYPYVHQGSPQTARLGCSPFGNTPEPNQPPPVLAGR